MDSIEEYKDLKIYFKDIKVVKNSNHDSIKALFFIEDSKGNIVELSPEKKKVSHQRTNYNRNSNSYKPFKRYLYNNRRST